MRYVLKKLLELLGYELFYIRDYDSGRLEDDKGDDILKTLEDVWKKMEMLIV